MNRDFFRPQNLGLVLLKRVDFGVETLSCEFPTLEASRNKRLARHAKWEKGLQENEYLRAT
jgi:hypothetical protein